MITESELLLTDEFVAFSQEIAGIHTTKKEKAAAFRKLYEAFQTETKTLDDQAAAAKKKWDAFVESKTRKENQGSEAGAAAQRKAK